jgi:hypothetical protein
VALFAPVVFSGLFIITKKVVKKKETTIDDLSFMTQRGFDALETRMNKRFDGVDKRFNVVDERLDVIEHLLIGRHD